MFSAIRQAVLSQKTSEMRMASPNPICGVCFGEMRWEQRYTEIGIEGNLVHDCSWQPPMFTIRECICGSVVSVFSDGRRVDHATGKPHQCKRRRDRPALPAGRQVSSSVRPIYRNRR